MKVLTQQNDSNNYKKIFKEIKSDILKIMSIFYNIGALRV